jgi:hypothetical protein
MAMNSSSRDSRDSCCAPSSEFEPLFIIMLTAIAEQQMRVLEWIAAEPPAMFDAFLKAGGTRNLFLDNVDDRSDHDAIFVGLQMAHEQRADKVFAFQCARLALRSIDCWSDDDDFGGGFTWTTKRLSRLFDAGYASAATVERHTAKLLDLCRRLEESRDHVTAARQLLREPFADIDERVEQFAIEPSPRQ